MLDLVFYPESDRTSHCDPAYVEMSESFYEWLAHSDFARVGQSQPRSFVLDGEKVELQVVDLVGETRQRLAGFLRDQIIEESDRILSTLNTLSSKSDIQATTYRLRKLQELRKCVENSIYLYLQCI